MPTSSPSSKFQWKGAIKAVLGRVSPTLLRTIIHWNLKRMTQKKNRMPKFFLNQLGKDSLVIDLGANFGGVSEMLAKTGAKVLAFEPDQNALVQLRFIAKRYPNIKIYPVAAGTQNRDTLLYLHKDTGKLDYNLSESSSLLEDHINVSTDLTQGVKEIDFAEFLLGLGPVDFIKMDIEGFEIALVNHLLDKSALGQVDRVFVETHENYMPHLTAKTEAMKKRIAQLNLTHKFFFDKDKSPHPPPPR
ncbi:MAG: FkbM family methyltransferase [Proteobacteria bacterium]|nr:FkbM family methyltransferase [Pseudomonadota bacterium]